MASRRTSRTSGSPNTPGTSRKIKKKILKLKDRRVANRPYEVIKLNTTEGTQSFLENRKLIEGNLRRIERKAVGDYLATSWVDGDGQALLIRQVSEDMRRVKQEILTGLKSLLSASIRDMNIIVNESERAGIYSN